VTKKIKRPGFEVTLDIKSENFVSTKDSAQRNWVFTRSLEELADDLDHLDRVSKRFVVGSERQMITERWVGSQAAYSTKELIIDGQQVMQDWERPYMEAMARVVTETHGDVLEIGFGMGISASYIQEMGVKSYTVIECNEMVKEKFEAWKQQFPKADCRLVFGKWQEVIDSVGLFDAIFFDTYPVSEDEFANYVVRDVTFAQHFFEAAARHLKPGGVFSYYSNEIDTVARRHQRELFKHFRSVTFSVCAPLFPPEDCNYWWADSMIVTKCIK
jgi:guanidinoacetate N-methyltransferase